MANKLIIQNNTGLTDLKCLDFVKEVIKMGRISNEGKQYCYVTAFEYGDKNYQISTVLNKKSDLFIFYEIGNFKRSKQL